MQSLQRQLNKAFKPERKQSPAYGKAKRLASKLGVAITIDDGYWIEDRRLEGEQYCTSWDEVLEKLERLA